MVPFGVHEGKGDIKSGGGRKERSLNGLMIYTDGAPAKGLSEAIVSGAGWGGGGA